MLRIAIITDDERLYQKVFLMLEGSASVVRCSGDRAVGYDRIIFDARNGAIIPFNEAYGSLFVGIGDGMALTYPFTEAELISAVTDSAESKAARLRPLPDERAVIIDGEAVALTEVEWRLFDLIARGDGEYVSRERLVEGVWGNSCTESSLNVYIHYLREKLERSGERIILSSRKCGYKIDEKFLR